MVLLGGDKGAVVEAEAEEEDPGGFNICERFILLLLLLIEKVRAYVCAMVAVEVDAKGERGGREEIKGLDESNK